LTADVKKTKQNIKYFEEFSESLELFKFVKIWHVHLNVNPAWVCKTQAGFHHFYVNVFFSGFYINNIFIFMSSHLKVSVPAVHI
jgi:hypothetical protein